MVRDLIERNNNGFQKTKKQNILKAQAKKQKAQKKPVAPKTKTYIAKVQIHIQPRTDEARAKLKTPWVTEYITVPIYPLINGTLDSREDSFILQKLEEKYGPYDFDIVNWRIKSLKEIHDETGFDKIKNKQKSFLYKFLGVKRAITGTILRR